MNSRANNTTTKHFTFIIRTTNRTIIDEPHKPTCHVLRSVAIDISARLDSHILYEGFLCPSRHCSRISPKGSHRSLGRHHTFSKKHILYAADTCTAIDCGKKSRIS